MAYYSFSLLRIISLVSGLATTGMAGESEVTLEFVAQAFVQAFSGTDVDAVASLYADRVDHTNSGVISNAAVRAQAQEYFARWPVRQWSLVGPVKTTPLGATRQKVIFSASYDASNPQTNKHASGIAKETLILASDKSGAVKIVSQREQTSKPSKAETAEKTPEALSLNEAKAEYGQQSGFACKLVARGKGVQVLSGYAQRHLENGSETLLGHVNTPASTSFGSPCAGVPWMAELGLDGKLLWAARVQDQREASSSWDGLTTDGDHLWAAAVRGNGLVQLARFKAGTLEREASVQTDFPVTESAGVRTGPGFAFHSQKEGDLQVSVDRTLPDSVKLVVFSRELRPVLDKIYTVPDRLAGRESEPLWGMNLIRLPDRMGYYMVIEPHLARGGKHGPCIGIIRLDDSGAVKWANTYPTGYSESGITPRVTKDGAILVSAATYSQPEPARSLLIKISPNGTVNWATTVEDIDISFGDFQFPCQSEPAPYRFTEPSLLALGIQRDDPQEGWWMMKQYSVLFRLNYETGKIEKQIKFGANTPGSCIFMEHDANSFYVGFANQQWLDKPNGHGSRPNRVKYHAAALRFGYAFNLLAACKIRDATSAATPVLHLFGSDNVVISYDGYEGKLMIEATNANLDNSNACLWLEKENFTFTKSTFQQHPAHVDSSPLTVTVSGANSKISEADLALAPLDLSAVPCQAERK